MGFLQTIPYASDDASDFRRLSHRSVTAPNTVFVLGTSRLANQFLDPQQRNRSNASWLNWANGRLRKIGKSFRTVGNVAVSGSRCDQWDTPAPNWLVASSMIDAAIASKASIVVLDGPVNDISRASGGVFSGSISGTTLTVASLNGFISFGSVITGSGVTAGTKIVAQLTANTYQVSAAQTVATTAMTSTGYTAEGGPWAGTAVTLANVAKVALDTLTAHVKRLNNAGQLVMYVGETGAGNFTVGATSMVGALNEFNRRWADYLWFGDADGNIPNVIVLDPPPARVVTSNATGITLKSSQDTVHDDIPAGQRIGFLFADKMAPYLREMPGHRLRSLMSSKQGNGNVGLIYNPSMTGTAVAAGGSGNSGNIPPNNWTASQSGSATAAFSVEATAADADGNTFGNQVKIACTATGAGVVTLLAVLDKGLFTPGDYINGGLEIDVAAGATGLGSVDASLEWFPTTGGTIPVFDMLDSTLGFDPGGYSDFVLESPRLWIVPGYTGTPFCNLVLRIRFRAAGSATVVTRKWWAERSPAA